MTATENRELLQPDAQGVRRMEFRALGTACVIQFRLNDERAALAFGAEALGWLSDFEAKFSRFRPASPVSQINAAAGKEWVKVDAEMERMLDMAEGLYNLTNGILDATMLPLLRVWDWKTVHTRLPEAAAVRQAGLLARPADRVAGARGARARRADASASTATRATRAAGSAHVAAGEEEGHDERGEGTAGRRARPGP